MNKIIFVFCSLLMSSVAVFGQNALEKDLKKSFRNYDLIELDGRATLAKAKSRQPIEVQAYGRYFQFVLTPNDLRSKNYRAAETSASGDKPMKPAEVTTFRGKLNGDESSEVRLTIEKGKVEGLIYTGDNKKFFIAQAVAFSSEAAPNEAVVYSENDLIKTVDLSDDSVLLPPDIEGKIDYGFGILKSESFVAAFAPETAAAAAAELKELEIATEADFLWVTQAGGAAAANNEILSILNLVDGIYKRDLNLTLKVTYQHAWSTADPFSTASSSGLLDSFLNYWNANFPASQYPRDAAHLFTGKFLNQGIAYTGVICVSSSYAYGVTGRSGSVNHLIAAHEIGHNLSADHIDNSGACATSIMNPIISFNATGFCETSKTKINNYTMANGRCLASGGTTTTPTTPTCTYAISPGSQSFNNLGGTGSISVTTQAGCAWTAGSNQNFVSIISAGSGNGNGVLSYYVAQNLSSSALTATITVAGKSFVVQQSGAPAVAANKTRFDFDGDGKADVSVFRPSNGGWYVSRSSNNSYYGSQFGQAGDLIAAADYDGDGKADTAVFRPSNGTWYLQRSASGFAVVQFGQSGDVPMPGDFDGDGKADISVYRPSDGSWYRLNSSTGQFAAAQFGQFGDLPVNGDFDGDLKTDIAVFRPSNGVWYILRSSNNSFYGVGFGQSGDIPTAADFDGDRKTDVAVYRPSTGTWFRLNSASGAFVSQQFGTSEDKPSVADYDGDNKADLAVYRPSSGIWYLQRSAAGFTSLQFGAGGDVPTSSIVMP